MEDSKENVLKFINLIKGPTVKELFEISDDEVLEKVNVNEWDTSNKIIEEIFTCGCCGRFSLILKFVFKDAESYLITRENDSVRSHVVTKIGEFYYDVNGIYDISYVNDMAKITDEEIINDNLDANYSFKTRGAII